MKTYKLCTYLFPLLLVTAQATQPNFNFNNRNNNHRNSRYRYANVNRNNTNRNVSYSNHFNNNNTNTKSDNSSIYVHGQQENWFKMFQNVKFKDLQQPLEQLYKNGIVRRTKNSNTVPLVYFVVGPTGAGKSTFIYTLQGNKVTETEEEETWGTCGQDNTNDVVESEHDTEGNKIDTGDLTLKKTVGVDIPKVAESARSVTEGVKIYYTGNTEGGNAIAFCDTEGFLGGRKKNNSNAQKIVAAYAPCFVLQSNKIGGIVFVVAASDLESSRGRNFFSCVKFLKGYFDLAITNEHLATLKKSIVLVINKQRDKEMSTIKRLAFLVKAAYEDYYKASKKNKKQESIGQLKPFLSLFLKKDVQEHAMNNTNFYRLLDAKNIRFFYPYEPSNVHKMRKKLAQLKPVDPTYLSLHDGPISQQLIRKMVDKASEVNHIVTEIHRILKFAKKNQTELNCIKKDVEKLIFQKRQLENQNYNILHDTNLELVYSDRHVSKKPLWSQTNTFYWGVRLECKEKDFIYHGDEPIYRIEIEDENHGSITCKNPSKYFITTNFNKQKERSRYDWQPITFTSKHGKGIKRDEWHMHHQTKAYEYANCKIRFYSRRCDLQATQWKVEANKNKIKTVNEKIKKLENNDRKRKENLAISYNQNMNTAKKYLSYLSRFKNELAVINCWKNHILKKNSANHHFVAENIAKYNKIWLDILPEQKIFIKKTNQKHANRQWLDKDDKKEDVEYNNYNQNNSSRSNFSSSVPTITALLSILLNQIKRQR